MGSAGLSECAGGEGGIWENICEVNVSPSVMR